MQIYLPIAEMPINLIVVMTLGMAVGFLSGVFGIGGGFLATPFLIFIGIPPAIAVATSTNQIVASSFSGVLSQFRRGGVDVKIGIFMIFGGMIGAFLGIKIFTSLQKTGQIDIVVPIIYVIFLGSIGLAMFVNSIKELIQKKYDINWESQETQKTGKLSNLIKKLPFKTYFPKSEIEISILLPIILSFCIGILVVLMGIGGGFLIIPAMIYILKMPSNVVIGTSLFQIIFIASIATFLQALTTNNLDILLSIIMIAGAAFGAQAGSKVSYKINAQDTKVFLSILILGVCVNMLFTLFNTPESLYIVEMIKS